MPSFYLHCKSTHGLILEATIIRNISPEQKAGNFCIFPLNEYVLIIIFFKQFVVTTCSKERSGSIVNETLTNRISILINTSKESNFYADLKYTSFIKFSLTNQKLRA